MNEENIKYTMLDLGDTEYETTLTRKFQMRKGYQPKDFNKITAFIPGTVRQLFVQEGQQVRKGDKLLILEAMKMRNELRAPKDGRVKKIYSNLDSMVPKGTLLMELE